MNAPTYNRSVTSLLDVFFLETNDRLLGFSPDFSGLFLRSLAAEAGCSTICGFHSFRISGTSGNRACVSSVKCTKNTYTCTHMQKCVSVVHMYILMHVCIQACAYVYMHMSMCMHYILHEFVYVYMHVSMHIHIYVYLKESF